MTEKQCGMKVNGTPSNDFDFLTLNERSAS